MMGEVGVPELLLIFAIALIVFGGRKLPEIGRSLGEGIRGFREAMRGEEPAAIASPDQTKK